MAILLPAEMITEARRDCVDTDSVDPAFADAVYITKLNKYYYMWYEKMERRQQRLSATATGFTDIDDATIRTDRPERIAQQVRLAMSDPDNLIRAGIQCRRVAENYSWKSVADRYAEIVSGLQ